MKRRHRSDSSLELLLDTICNTFGGVLFLAILVIVLLQGTSNSQVLPDASQSITAELMRLSEEHANLELQLAALREVLKNQSLLTERFIQPEKARLMAELQQLRADYEAMMEDRNTFLHETAKRQARIQEIENELRELDAELVKTRSELLVAEKGLQSDMASRSKSTALPRLRSTYKIEVGLIVRYGRAYLWHRYTRDGVRLGLNTDDFVVLGEVDGKLLTKPKPYAGVDLRNSTSAAGIARRLTSFQPTRHYLCLSVWPDSFAEFQVLKSELVKLGFEYRLMPMAEGVSLVDQGGTGGQVQ